MVNFRTTAVWVILILSISLSMSRPLSSKQTNPPKRIDIFASPQNLKVLPQNLSSQELRDIVKEFSMALRLRCKNCHKGEASKPLPTFDFSSDEKFLKKKARVMWQMFSKINRIELPKLNTVDTDPRVVVRCVTCHRGQRKPKLIQDILTEEVTSNNIESAVKTYQSLRESYYGSHTYDFSEMVLPMFASKLSSENRLKEAIHLIKLSIDYHPNSYFSYFSLGKAYDAIGDYKNTLAAYQNALMLNPKAGFIKQAIKSLQEKNR